MEVILLEDVPKLGDMGELVDVKPGYARNYLIPQKLAVRASVGNKAQFTHQRQMIESRKHKMRAAALDTQGQLDNVSITIAKKAGDSDKLFGSVTARDISATLGTQGIEVDHKKVMLDQPVRELGIYDVMLKLHSDIKAKVRVWVVAL
ncbi:MAG: 50S ribosomal protein L9 [Myxococcota bacterium]